MNLYLFNATDNSNLYGLGTYLKELIHALKSADINIHVVHLHATCLEFEIKKPGDVENWYIPEVLNTNTYTRSTHDLEDYCRNVVSLLRLYIKDTKDLIFHFNFNHYQLLAKELKTVFNCKTVITIHYTKWEHELHGNLFRFHAIKKKPEHQRTPSEKLLYLSNEYDSLLLKEVDRIIILSQYTKNMVINEYQPDSSKISVIPNGLADIYQTTAGQLSIHCATDREALRRKWDIAENEFIVLFVGRLHAVKGVKFLIESFRKVLKKIPECRLIVAGHGNFDNYLKECEDIWTHVTWTGRVNKERLYELYQIADIGVMPSFHEQCSYVAIEMMMHGMPLIASASTGLKEMIIDGETGLHIPVIECDDRTEIDADLLAEKMLYLLQHPEERKRLGANARRRYETVYSANIFRQNMLAFYRSLFLHPMYEPT